MPYLIWFERENAEIDGADRSKTGETKIAISKS
jgi:hypothetical protein